MYKITMLDFISMVERGETKIGKSLIKDLFLVWPSATLDLRVIRGAGSVEPIGLHVTSLNWYFEVVKDD